MVVELLKSFRCGEGQFERKIFVGASRRNFLLNNKYFPQLIDFGSQSFSTYLWFLPLRKRCKCVVRKTFAIPRFGNPWKNFDFHPIEHTLLFYVEGWSVRCDVRWLQKFGKNQPQTWNKELQCLLWSKNIYSLPTCHLFRYNLFCRRSS